ncbi:MAG: DnaJ domain-containing protein [Alphaproteobacteria bacterium]|nr:DnaJ domain-containing protein [Alphaproteobacteria bacterium]
MQRITFKDEDFNPLNLYERLGIESNATAPEITRAYKKRAFETHPDRHPDDQENATKQFVAVGRAYDILKNPAAKSAYDRELSTRDNRQHQTYTHSSEDEKSKAKPNYKNSDFYTDVEYTQEELKRYKEALDRLKANCAKSGDFSTVFNHLAGSPSPQHKPHLESPSDKKALPSPLKRLAKDD